MLKKSIQNGGNTYGVFRAELLTTLIHMMQSRSVTESGHLSSDAYRDKYFNQLIKLTKKYNSGQQFSRENDVIEYLQHNILQMDIPYGY